MSRNVVALARVDNLTELNATILAWCSDEHSQALIRCPHGHIVGIPDHTIDAQGFVTPSLLLSYPVDGKEKCGWHVFARLEGWEGQA